MLKLEEILKRIEGYKEEVTTTKELKSLGLNDYYIKKACENCSLKKISRGKYEVVAVVKNKKNEKSFAAFAKSVFSNDFESAYNYLVENVKNQTNHDYDYNLKLYSILLKELLPNDKDFSFANDIIAFCDYRCNNDSYYRYFKEFTEAVLSYDFIKANEAIKKYSFEENLCKGFNNFSIKLFEHLSNCIQHKLIKTTKKETNKEDLERQKKYHKENYALMRINIAKENYEEALINLENALKYATPKTKINLKKMQKIIKKYLEIKTSKETLIKKSIDYEKYQDNHIKIFNKALDLNDYDTAFKNIGKCIYSDKNSITLQIYRNLLSALIKENKKNMKNNLELEDNKDKNLIISSQELKEAEIGKDPKEESNYSEVNLDTLLDLIYERKYDDAKELLKNQENLDNDNKYMLSMFRYIENLKSSNLIKERAIHIFRNDEYNIFKRFFEALYYRYYEEAFNLVDECIKVAKKHKNSKKFVVYKYILEDILYLKEEIIANQEKNEELTKIQKSIIQKHVLKSEDFEQLEKATIEKMELSLDNDTSYDKHVVEMLEALRNINEYNLDSNSFERFEYSKKGVLERFLEAVSLGDYQEAYQISKEDNWEQKMKKSENKSYLIIYKKLLDRINKKIEDNSKPIEVKLSEEPLEEPLEENPLIEHLATLKLLFKKRKFIKAYNYYQENNLEGINSELDLMLQLFLTYIKLTVHNESKEIENKYKAALNRGDYEEATKNLNKYEDFIKVKDLDRNIDYHKARIATGKIEIYTPDFVEKEQLYDTAYYYFQNEQYEKAIEVLNKYISKDNDISPKGYFLRGKSYEWLKRFQDAKIDYEKALTIAPEPNIYHRLGKINYYSGDYEKALECFLEYEARRPNLHDTNLEALSKTYQALGQFELSKKYKKI